MSVSYDLRVIAPRQVVVSRKNCRAFALLYFFDHCPIFCSLLHPQDAFATSPTSTARRAHNLMSSAYNHLFESIKKCTHLCECNFFMVAGEGLEPTTSGL